MKAHFLHSSYLIDTKYIFTIIIIISSSSSSSSSSITIIIISNSFSKKKFLPMQMLNKRG